MHLGRWKKIKQLNELQNKWWTYRTDEIQLPSGKPGEYHYVHTNGSSLVVPLTNEGKIIMVRQYRYLASRDSLEFPCGSVKDGSSYEETAKHELAEEAGVEAGEILLTGRFNPYNGVTDEMCNVYVARGLKDVFVPHDETEEFEKIILTVSEVENKIKSNEIWDGMSLAAWLITKDHL